jgi:hypothetical protein
MSSSRINKVAVAVLLAALCIGVAAMFWLGYVTSVFD